MIKLVFCLRRRDDVSEEEFHRYWLEEHGPLVRKHAEALGIRRYQQVHQVLPDFSRALGAGRGAPEPYDGVAELWWDDADALAAPGQTEAGLTRTVGTYRRNPQVGADSSGPVSYLGCMRMPASRRIDSAFM